jgi:molybdopterin/thiamine biosynthesis adenylyltransferase
LRDWTENELTRFSRQIVLREVGGNGQDRLLSSRVALVGMGGIGAPAAMFLAAAGIGKLRLIDHDSVDLSNLHRQVLYRERDVGRSKVEAAADGLLAANPALRIERHAYRITPSNVAAAVAGVDVVLDGTDTFDVRAMVAAACARAEIPLVSASVQGFDGQLVVLRPYLGAPHPSYRCIYPEDPEPGSLPSCTLSGVLGPVPGTIAGLASTEVIKLLLKLNDPALAAPLVCYDALSGALHQIAIPRSPAAEEDYATPIGASSPARR